MKEFLKRDFGPWLRHKVRVIILKQWKKRPTIYKNLCKINRITKANIQEERIYSIANARQGLYRMAMIQDIRIREPYVRCNKREINFIYLSTLFVLYGYTLLRFAWVLSIWARFTVLCRVYA